jgi:hypothetical protein
MENSTWSELLGGKRSTFSTPFRGLIFRGPMLLIFPKTRVSRGEERARAAVRKERSAGDNEETALARDESNSKGTNVNGNVHGVGASGMRKNEDTNVRKMQWAEEVESAFKTNKRFAWEMFEMEQSNGTGTHLQFKSFSFQSLG